jgi:excisionase family DNA binding protein
MAQIGNSLSTSASVFVGLDSILAGVGGQSTSGSLIIDGEKIDLSPRGVRILAVLVAATPEDQVDHVEQLLIREVAEGADEGNMISLEAAAILGVSRHTVIRWESEGQLANHRVGTHHRYARKDVEDLRNSRKEVASAARLTALTQRERLLEEGLDLDMGTYAKRASSRWAGLKGNPPRRCGPHAGFLLIVQISMIIHIALYY